MASLPAPILVTGANGHLGRGLIERVTRASGDPKAVRAVVRSERAAEQVRATAAVDVRIVDYTDAHALAEAARECRAVVHFVGIIKETRDASYAAAHEATCEALVRAAPDAGLERIVYLSIFGARASSDNACLASKGRAEEILLAGPVPACILRVPMVLGSGDYASFSLRKQATSGLLPLVGGGRTLQQPIDSADVIRAVLSALTQAEPIRGALDLGGPECLSHRELVQRAASLYDSRPRFVSIPLALARTGVGLLEKLSANPPMTLTMLDVLQHDDQIDTAPVCKQLDLQLTSLDETLRRCVGPEQASR